MVSKIFYKGSIFEMKQRNQTFVSKSKQHTSCAGYIFHDFKWEKSIWNTKSTVVHQILATSTET